MSRICHETARKRRRWRREMGLGLHLEILQGRVMSKTPAVFRAGLRPFSFGAGMSVTDVSGPG